MEWFFILIFVVAITKVIIDNKKQKNEDNEKLKTFFKANKKESAVNVLGKIKENFVVKSNSNEAVIFRTKLDIDYIKDLIKDDRRDGIVIDTKDYYNFIVKDIESYLEAEINTIEDFIDNKNFKNIDKYGILNGFGSDLHNLYLELTKEQYSDKFEFEKGMFKALSVLGCTQKISSTEEMKKYYISSNHTVNSLKKILTSKGFKATEAKEALVNETYKNNLIKIPNFVTIKKTELLKVFDEIIRLYAKSLSLQIKPYNKTIKKIIIEEALIENNEFKTKIQKHLK